MTDYEERFWAKVDKSGDCWLWTAATDRGGYGRIRLPKGPVRYAHRLAYEQLVGPIPEGLTLDHLCRNRGCVNPAHLEPVTLRTNVMRSPEQATAINARKTHCLRGHPFSGDNLAFRPNGIRRCRECARLLGRATYQRQRSAR